MRTCLILLMLCFAGVAKAGDFNNGCGSGWNAPVVPDRIGLLCIDFRASCAAHDNCYSKCLKGGENFGKPICEQSSFEQREGRRAICDTSFKAMMKRGCNSTACDPVRKAVCRGVAAIYAVAVNAGGGGSFKGVEVPPGYYDFLKTEAAQRFDFDAFVREFEPLQGMSASRKNYRLEFKMQNGRPVASILDVLVPPTEDSHTIEDPNLKDLKDLDIQNLQNLQQFTPRGP